MANDTSTAGYLLDVAADAEDRDLDRILQQAVVGITGLPGDLVRPRWQPEMPTNPEYTVDWCAVGITSVPADNMAYVGPDPSSPDDQDVVERDEELEVLHSFYGPNASSNAKRMRDGLALTQNRAFLHAVGIALVEVGRAVQVPVLLTERWVKRFDIPITYRRRTRRSYKVLTIQSGALGIDNELYVTPITVNVAGNRPPSGGPS